MKRTQQKQYVDVWINGIQVIVPAVTIGRVPIKSGDTMTEAQYRAVLGIAPDTEIKGLPKAKAEAAQTAGKR